MRIGPTTLAYGPALGMPGIGLGAIPTNDGLVGLFVGTAPDVRTEFDRDFDGTCLKAMQEVAPELRERFGRARRVGEIYRRGYMPAYYRRPYGPGWALVGDAGFIQWPSTGHGITDAFRDASLLADALHAFYMGVAGESEALAAYARLRDEVSWDLFEAVHGSGVSWRAHRPRLRKRYGKRQ